MQRSRILLAGAAVVITAVVAAIAVLWPDDESDGPNAAESAATNPTVTTTPPTVTAAPTTSPAPMPPEGAVDVADRPDSFLIASLTRDIGGFDKPDGQRTGTVAATWHERPSQLPVIDQAPGWLHVRLPQRPNESTAWVRREHVELFTTPYRIEVDVATMRLKLYDEGEVVLEAPAGIGTDDAPTTVGRFFVTFLQKPPDTTPGWGPFVIVTSNHSETISDFESSGDAIAAIHGPLGSDEEIGTTGAKVSHGCVRLHLDDLEQLRDVPAGSPVDVIDSSAPPEADA